MKLERPGLLALGEVHHRLSRSTVDFPTLSVAGRHYLIAQPPAGLADVSGLPAKQAGLEQGIRAEIEVPKTRLCEAMWAQVNLPGLSLTLPGVLWLKGTRSSICLCADPTTHIHSKGLQGDPLSAAQVGQLKPGKDGVLPSTAVGNRFTHWREILPQLPLQPF